MNLKIKGNVKKYVPNKARGRLARASAKLATIAHKAHGGSEGGPRPD